MASKMGVLWKPIAALFLLLHLVYSDSNLPTIDVEATGKILYEAKHGDVNSLVWSVCQLFSSSAAVN